MSDISSHAGTCFCGAVKFNVTGDPAAMGYCHCASCRHWSAGPVNAFSLWQPGALQVTQGADKIGTYNHTPISYRKWCKSCGGHLFTEPGPDHDAPTPIAYCLTLSNLQGIWPAGISPPAIRL